LLYIVVSNRGGKKMPTYAMDPGFPLRPRRFLAMAQEPHGQFHFGAEGTPGAVEPPLPEDLEERLAEAENASVSLTLLGAEAEGHEKNLN
jgi:hypothetical protein